MIKNYGFQYPVIDEKKDYVLGAERSTPFEVINESGGWNDKLVIGETQIKKEDVNGCTNWACLNQLEVLLNFLFGTMTNWSERFQAVVSEQTREGNDPARVFESIRKLGVIEESKLPFTDEMNFQTYLSPKPMTENYLKDAKKFLEDYDYKHEYIYTPNTPLVEKQKLLLQSLKRSPVAVSVYAWQMGANGMYVKPQGAKDTHFTLLINAKKGEWWEVFDSYPESEGDFIKRLEWNFEMDIAKGIFVRKFTDEEKRKLSFFEQILAAIAKMIPLLGFWVQKKKEDPKPTQDDDQSTQKPPKPELPKPEPVIKVSKILGFCQAVKIHEGFFEGSRSQRNNNPGNLRFTSLTASLGATSKDLDNFAYFPSYEIGWNALLSFVKLAANNQLRDYKDCDILSFFKTYAPASDNNSTTRYAEFVARQINDSPESLLKDFI